MTLTVDTEPASQRFLTVSNLLSISRAVLAVPFVLVMLSPSTSARWWGLGIIALAIVTDRLDGLIARKYHQVTEWGKILDPVADKVAVAAGGLVLVLRGALPLWFVIAIVARDLLIFSGGMYLKSRTGIVLPSNVAGKVTIGFIGVTLALAVVGVPDWLMTTGLYSSLAMLLLSLALYIIRFTRQLRA